MSVLLFFQDEAIQKRREELVKEQEEKRKQRQVNFLTICLRKDINGKAENTLIFYIIKDLYILPLIFTSDDIYYQATSVILT